MDDEVSIITGQIDRLTRLGKYGIPYDGNVAFAAGFILDNLTQGFPTRDLVTAAPFDTAFAYLTSAGLVTPEHQITELGVRVYSGEPAKVYPLQ